MQVASQGVMQLAILQESLRKMDVPGVLTAALVLTLLASHVSTQYNVQDRPTGIVAPDRCRSLLHVALLLGETPVHHANLV